MTRRFAEAEVRQLYEWLKCRAMGLVSEQGEWAMVESVIGRRCHHGQLNPPCPICSSEDGVTVAQIDVLFKGERDFLVLIETPSRVLSFVLTLEQRNQLVYQLMNPDCE